MSWTLSCLCFIRIEFDHWVRHLLSFEKARTLLKVYLELSRCDCYARDTLLTWQALRAHTSRMLVELLPARSLVLVFHSLQLTILPPSHPHLCHYFLLRYRYAAVSRLFSLDITCPAHIFYKQAILYGSIGGVVFYIATVSSPYS